MDEQKLEEMYEFTKDNNRMLHAMRRNARIGMLFKFVFWFIILVGVPYVSWLYFAPYLHQIQGTYQAVHTQSQAISNSPIAKFFGQFGTTTKK